MNKRMIILTAAIAVLSLSVEASQPKVFTVEELVSKAAEYSGQVVTLRGRATHICSRTRDKIFLSSTDGKRTFRCNAGSELGVFDRAAVSKMVTITGVLTEQRVTMDDLVKREQTAIEAERLQKAEHHCSSEAKANAEDTRSTVRQRIVAQQNRLKRQIEAGGKPYLSFFSLTNCQTYSFE